MKRITQLFLMAGVVAALGIGTTNLLAQADSTDAKPAPPSDQSGRGGRGGWDPEAMKQRRMDRIREQMEVKSDDEWKILSDRVTKVMDAQREMMGGMAMGFRGFGGRSSGSGSDSSSSDSRRSRFSSFLPQPSPEEEALQKAVEDKASADDLKAKLAKVRAVRKEREAKLEKAQEDLKKVLSVKQEAVAVVNGLLK